MEITEVNMQIHTIEGFSGHSDRKQLLSYVRRISPKPRNIIVCHGEEERCNDLANTISRRYKITVSAPDILETIRVL